MHDKNILIIHIKKKFNLITFKKYYQKRKLEARIEGGVGTIMNLKFNQIRKMLYLRKLDGKKLLKIQLVKSD